MKNFTFYSPTFFAFGKDRENETGAYVKHFGGTKVLIHYGGGSVVRSGLLDQVKASLEKEDVPYVVLGGVQPNPRLILNPVLTWVLILNQVLSLILALSQVLNLMLMLSPVLVLVLNLVSV